jgi:hypothetical protein
MYGVMFPLASYDPFAAGFDSEELVDLQGALFVRMARNFHHYFFATSALFLPFPRFYQSSKSFRPEDAGKQYYCKEEKLGGILE